MESKGYSYSPNCFVIEKKSDSLEFFICFFCFKLYFFFKRKSKLTNSNYSEESNSEEVIIFVLKLFVIIIFTSLKKRN